MPTRKRSSAKSSADSASGSSAILALERPSFLKRAAQKQKALEVQLRIFPIFPLAVAAGSRTAKLNRPVLIFTHADVMAAEEVFTFRAEAKFPQRIPLLQRVSFLEEPELSSFSLRQHR